MKTILATAYAINPFKGSEDGMGWNFVMQIARFNKVIAITRENNRPHIEKFIAENNSEYYKNIQFLYFDLPYWMRFWKKGGRGAMLYYQMWQRGVVSFIKKQNLDFDIVHNLNFHNDWTPSHLWKLKIPFIWGPIGHHSIIPSQYFKHYAKKYWIQDRATWFVKLFFWHFSLSLRKTIKKSNHIFCMNSDVPKRLHLNKDFSIMPSVATQDFGWNEVEKESDTFRIISAGRFVPLKGFDLTIAAFAQFFHALDKQTQKKCELVLVGNGPEEQFLKELVLELGIAKHVKFVTWIERSELMKLFKESSAFLFPSHEGAGMVVAEALSFGLPVICLNNDGPGEFINSKCGFAIPIDEYKNTVSGLSNALTNLFSAPEKRAKMRIEARKHFETSFHWDKRGEQLQKIYGSL